MAYRCKSVLFAAAARAKHRVRTGRLIRPKPARCGDMCTDMCIDMRIDMHIDMHIDMRIDMCIDMGIDLCIDMCTVYRQ